MTLSDIDWKATGGVLIDFDDGHVPENLSEKGQLVTYPDFLQRPQCVKVFDNAVEKELVDSLYSLTVEEKRPWGTYVAVADIREYCKQSPESSRPPEEDVAARRQDLALAAAAAFLQKAEMKNPSLVYQKDEDKAQAHLWSASDLTQAHGVAVWALAADIGSQVPYHLDYAEQIRYDSNIIVPPVLAGTLHCTNTEIQGGEYCVNLDGLKHYQRCGYKGCKSSCMDSAKLMEQDDGWARIPYRYNRMICQSGHLPHLSTSIQSFADSNCKRVILGFNVFMNDVGPTVQLVPEHSDAFRQKVRVQRLLFQKRRLSLQTIQQNPSLAKLLVLAKRQKLKQDFAKAQDELDARLYQYMNEAKNEVTVQVLMDRFGREDGQWPNQTDVQVHIHHRYQQGRLCIPDGCEQTVKHFVQPEQVVRLPNTVEE